MRFRARHSLTIILFAFLICPPVSGQVSNVGSETTLEVATWNIEWFGDPNNGPSNDAGQLRNVTDIIAGAGIDLWALQEIADVDQFNELLARLGAPWESVLADISSGQRMAYVYRSDVLSLRSSTQILQSFNYEFAGRPPLKAEFAVTLPDTSYTMTAINVHMKAFSDTESHDRRTEGARRIKTHIEFTSLGSEPVLFIGDFNDNLEGSITAGRNSPYDIFVDDEANYFPVTLELERNGVSTFCGGDVTCSGGSTIDHMIVSSEYLPLLETSATARLSSVLNYSNYVNGTSDHAPVYAVFRSTVNTATDRAREIPERLSLQTVYPNPFADRLNAMINVPDMTDLELQLVDPLGRTVWSERKQKIPAGQHEMLVEPGSLSAGVYLFVAESRFGRVTVPVSSAGSR